MRFSYIIIALLTSLTLSCDRMENTEYSQLYDEVMEIHDDVMPKMRDIHKAKKQIKKLKNTELTEEISQQITSLDAADEAMMSWMANFKKPKMENMADNITYLKEQKESITQVRDVMLNTIEEAETFIKNNQ